MITTIFIVILTSLALFGLYSVLDSFIHFKDRLLDKKTVFKKSDRLFIKEIIRSDGYVVFRDFLTKVQYNQEIRKQKLERICND